jgi:hypothetical protein
MHQPRYVFLEWLVVAVLELGSVLEQDQFHQQEMP